MSIRRSRGSGWSASASHLWFWLGVKLPISQLMSSGTVSSPTLNPSEPRLLAPPNVALPGSGTPVGAPPQIGVNDARNGGAGAVYSPGSTNVQTNATIATPSATIGNNAALAAAA